MQVNECDRCGNIGEHDCEVWKLRCNHGLGLTILLCDDCFFNMED